jgi:hypothetical protein
MAYGKIEKKDQIVRGKHYQNGKINKFFKKMTLKGIEPLLSFK